MDETPISNPFDEDERSGSRPIVWALLGIVAIGCGVIFAIALFYFQPDAKSLYAQYFPRQQLPISNTHIDPPLHQPHQHINPNPNMTATAGSKC
jgi:hypothetical protein